MPWSLYSRMACNPSSGECLGMGGGGASACEPAVPGRPAAGWPGVVEAGAVVDRLRTRLLRPTAADLAAGRADGLRAIERGRGVLLGVSQVELGTPVVGTRTRAIHHCARHKAVSAVAGELAVDG